MKHILLVLLVIGLSILTRAQKQYEVSSDGTHKIIKGIITRDTLETDTAFRWFHDNQKGYTPNAETVSVLKAKGPEVRFVVLGGTWCEDTQNLLPKFFALLDAAGIAGDQVTVIGVDHQKRSIDATPETMHLVSTPTFVVMKDGKEVGRIVEYGKNGQWEQELGEIVATKFN